MLNDSLDNLNSTILSEDEVDGAVEEADQTLRNSGANFRDSQMQKKRSATEKELLAAGADDFFDSLPDLGKAFIVAG